MLGDVLESGVLEGGERAVYCVEVDTVVRKLAEELSVWGHVLC